MHFPFIKSSRSPHCSEALAALRVSSLIKGDLLIGSYYNPADDSQTTSRIVTSQLRHARESLLSAIASWPSSTTMEFRFTVSPNLKHKAQGRIDIYLLIRCHAMTEEESKEAVATRFLALMPLLGAFQPEACWEPATTEDGLYACTSPFTPSHAVSVHRHREPVLLSAPLRQPSVGFTGRDPSSAQENGSSIEHLYCWLPSHDDWLRLLETLTGQLDPLQIIIRLKAGTGTADENSALDNVIQRCEGFLMGLGSEQLTLNRTVGLLRDGYIQRLLELKDAVFNVGAFLVAPHPIDSSLANVLGRSISGVVPARTDSFAFQGGFDFHDVPVEDVLDADFFFDEAPFSLTEAACAFRLPSPPSRDIPGLAIKRFRTSLAQLPLSPDGQHDAVKLFVSEHQGMTQPVFIGSEDRMRHCFIVGQTGTGKSTLMESMILQDISAGRGVAVIDPHGEMIDGILGKISSERVEDVILFDLLDRERPIGFNIIEWHTIEERDLLIDELYRTLDHVYDMKQTGGPIFEQHFRNMMKVLMGDKPRAGYVPTILEFIRCYIDENFRHWLMKTVSDPQVLDFVREAEEVRGDAAIRNVAPYITSKFGRFVNDTALKRIIGQEQSRIDFEDIMNSGRILLVKLGKGRFGSQVSALLANMFVARFKFAAMKRGEMPKEERRDFFLYVDEAHNLPQDNFTELLSEARKYRLGLVLATQYCSQLGDVAGRRGNDLLAAIFGNVGTTILFRTGATDAEQLAKGLTPYFDQLDILGLPNFHGYARMNLSREATTPFSFRTEKDDVPENRELAARIRSFSRLKYGQDAVVVDAEISSRSTIWKREGSAGNNADKAPKNDRQEKRGAPSFVNLVILDMDINDLDFSVRTLNCLKNAGIRSIGDLLCCTHEDLVKKHDFKMKSLVEVQEILNDLGCSLREGDASEGETPEFDFSTD